MISGPFTFFWEEIIKMPAMELVIRGMRWNTTLNTLRKYFSQYGKVNFCRISYNLQTGYPNNFATLRINLDQEGRATVKKTSHFVDNRKLNVEVYSVGARKESNQSGESTSSDSRARSDTDTNTKDSIDNQSDLKESETD